jgi:hypothetical protein
MDDLMFDLLVAIDGAAKDEQDRRWDEEELSGG